MFTGLIEGIGRVVAAATLPMGRRLEVELGPVAAGVRLGDSVALSGVCLTVTGLQGDRAGFDLSQETLDRTGLGAWTPGRRVNLERSLRVGDRLGGHFVTGHVDARAPLLARLPEGDFARLRIGLPADLRPLVVEKGSIAVDGVSLTVAALRADAFEVALIPETLRRTTLGEAAVGEPLNLEADVLAKHVQRLLAAREAAPAPHASA